MRFIESEFLQDLSTNLSDDELKLLDKVVGDIYPASTFHNIAHQLKFLLTSLNAFNKLDLPDTFLNTNQKLLSA